MNITDIINKNSKKIPLSKKEIKYVVDGYESGIINDKDMTLFLKSVCKNSLNYDEISYLTTSFIESGETLDLSYIKGIKVDKHSTGGVGDKTTLIIAPIVACLGVPVAKMSGRGLGFTGGTIDKLESIPGFNVNMSEEEFIKEINNIGLSIISQTKNLVPADKSIYALRDVTNTVSSIGLIASSIMSKKIASGSDKVLIDVKVGRGALMSNYEEAFSLAETLIKIGEYHDLKVISILTNMDYPLGFNVGNALEIKEVIDILRNKTFNRLRELSIVLASYMVQMGLEISYEEANKQVLSVLENNQAYLKFLEFIKYQGGKIDNMLESSKKYEVFSERCGYIVDIDALTVGEYVRDLGAGRINKSDAIDHSVGIVFNVEVGSYVEKNDLLYTIHYNNEPLDLIVLKNAVTIKDNKIKEKLIYEILEGR